MNNDTIPHQILQSIKDVERQVTILSIKIEQHSGEVSAHSNQLESLKEITSDIKHDLKTLKDDVTKLNKEFKGQIEEEVSAINTDIKELKDDAFPNGDTHGHKIFHESLIDHQKNVVDVKKEVFSHILKGAFWAILVGVVWAIIYSAKGWIVAP